MAQGRGGDHDYYAWFEDQRMQLRRHKMELHISVIPGDGITGYGKDFVGEFVLDDGELTPVNRSQGLWEIGFVKRYNEHGVVYRGIGCLVNSVLTVTGAWHLEHFRFVDGNWECHLLIAPPAA